MPAISAMPTSSLHNFLIQKNLDQIHVTDPLCQCLSKVQEETQRLEERMKEIEERCKNQSA